jgi:hypothetical protein
VRLVQVNGSGICSACYAQKQIPHVDFEAAWDGPRFQNAGPNGETITVPVQIDDLVLCQECVAEAALLIPSPHDPIMARLKREKKADREAIKALERQVVALKHALSTEQVA